MPASALPPAATLYFVRHGETDWNAQGRLQGQRDVPLNDTGRRQASDVARHLRALAPAAHELPFHVSPLGRTRETAELLREQIGLPRAGYALEPRLAELSFGRWEGMTWKEVRARHPDAPKRVKRGWDYQPPDGESYAMLAQRVSPWLATLQGDAVIVSHGGVARVLISLVAGLPGDEATLEDIWQGRVLVLQPGSFRWS